MNLSGVWYGRYHGTGDVAPNRFIALLSDHDGRLGGSISEPDDLGIADLRRASVSGTRGGRSIHFVKLYDGAVLAHAVDYEGVVDDKGDVITGRWRLAGHASSFVMERDASVVEEVGDMIATEEPAG